MKQLINIKILPDRSSEIKCYQTQESDCNNQTP